MSQDAEPTIHSNIADKLPDEHPLAHSTVNCDRCKTMVHAFSNECMETWVEVPHYENGPKQGNYCLPCFVIIDEEW